MTATGSPAFAAGGSPTPPKAPTASSGSESVIVTLRDHLAGTPVSAGDLTARSVAAKASQSAVLRRLGSSVTDLQGFSLVNAFSATVTNAQAQKLAADPAVASVIPDRSVSISPVSGSQLAQSVGGSAAAPNVRSSAGMQAQAKTQTQAKTQAQAGVASPTPVPAGVCSTDPTKPLLEPEALQTMNARSSDPNAKTAAALGIDGSGVKVAFIADGINPDNSGFRRANGTSAIIDYKDFYGDGPNAVTSGAEAFGDASAIAAQGNTVYDLAQFGNPNVVSYPGGHCYVRIVGVAPGASVVALKAGSELLPNSSILQAIDYAVNTDHVDVLSESFGANTYPDVSTRNTIQQFDDAAVAAGVTVTVSTGDAGVTGTIGSPSADPLLISAGATTDSRSYMQSGYALAPQFSNGTWQDSNISSLSSAGLTQEARTIDLSAPGEADWAVCDSGGTFVGCTSFRGSLVPFQLFGGTSQSAPMTAGTAALVIQAYRKAHGGASPTPALVKQLLTSTATDLGLPGEEQGSGLINARAAVEAALQYGTPTTSTAGVTPKVVLSTNQLTLTGHPGSAQTGTVTVTNVGHNAVTVLPSTRQALAIARSTQTVALSASSTQTLPYPVGGAPWAYKTVTFTVPSGADRLSATILWQSGAGPTQAGPVVRMTLIDPSGTYQANTRPQGGAAPANYGNVDVRSPKAGTWTAILYTSGSAAGFTGNVTLQTEADRNVPVGSVSPSLLTLAPGASAPLTVHLRTPSNGGDTTDVLQVNSSGGNRVAVPVVLRSLIDTSSGHGTFAGTILGGNARSFSPAQTLSYAFDVPRGVKDVDIAATLAQDPGDLLESVLISPTDEQASVSTNSAPDGSGTLMRSTANVVANPAPGRWRYVIVVENPVSGKEISQALNGTVSFNQQHWTGNIPENDQWLPLKTNHTVTLTVHNPLPVPVSVGVDARTNDYASHQLVPQFAGSTVPLPLSVDNLSNIPGFLVPPDTTSLSVSAASTVPAQVELSSPGGGIDVFGDLQAAKAGETISTATVNENLPEHVGQGVWFPYVQEIGPFTDAGAATGSSTLVAQAVTKGWDSSVTSSTGDPFRPSVDAADNGGHPVMIAAHGTAVIKVTFRPNARRGLLIHGVLHLVTAPIGTPLFNTTGDVLATIPFAYKIG